MRKKSLLKRGLATLVVSTVVLSSTPVYAAETTAVGDTEITEDNSAGDMEVPESELHDAEDKTYQETEIPGTEASEDEMQDEAEPEELPVMLGAAEEEDVKSVSDEIQVVNGDFEAYEGNVITGWVYGNPCEAMPELEENTDNYLAKITRGEITQDITLEPYKNYTVTARFKSDVRGYANILVKPQDPSLTEPDTVVKTTKNNEWENAELTFSAPEDGKITLVLRGYIRQKCWFDDVVITEVATDYTALQAAIGDAESKIQGKDSYTPETWAVYEEAYNRAVSVNENPESFQYEIDAAATVLNSALAGLILASPEGANVYYIDSQSGNDQADGLTPETAWKSLSKVGQLRLDAGDQVLLKAGCVWNGEKLTINEAKGSDDAKVVIGKYGEGELPILNGQGGNWEYSRKEELATVHVFNSSDIIIENLEVTNYDAEAANYGSGIIPESDKLLSAIVVEGRDAGQLKNITVRNNVVHDVNGRMTGGTSKSAGGIIFYVNGTDFTNPDNKTWFDNISIVGNEVYDVCHEAIYMQSLWGKRPLVAEGDGEWAGWDNVYIAHNYIHHTAGDGIVIINTKNALAEYNLVDGVANEDYSSSGNPAHAGLWCWDANNVVMQYNEVCNTESTKDGMAFDFDYGVQNSIYQYNYTHNNKGGFFMVCPSPWGATVNCVARYNVSVNDGGFDGTRIMRFGGQNSYGIQVYNNTIYWADSVGSNFIVAEKGTWDGGSSRGTRVFNNILYGPSGEEQDAEGRTFAVNGVTYDNNCVWGGCEDAYLALDMDKDAVIADPQFKDTKNFTHGSFADNMVTLGAVDGFMLEDTSPCISEGAEIPDAPQQNEDILIQNKSLLEDYVDTPIQKPAVDYYGNPIISLSNPNIGAYDGKGNIGSEAVELNVLYKTCAKKDLSAYTTGSQEVFASVLEDVEKLLDQGSLTAEDEENAKVSLQQALIGLVKKGDLTSLEALMNGLEQAALPQGSYTEYRWNNLLNAKTAAQAVLQKQDPSQTDVMQAEKDLEKAIRDLRSSQKDSAEEELAAVRLLSLSVIYNAKAEVSEGYTKGSQILIDEVLRKLSSVIKTEDERAESTVLTLAEKLVRNSKITSDEKKLYPAMIAAEAELQEIVRTGTSKITDKTALENTVEAYGCLIEERYTKNGWENFQKALDDAKNILNSANATQTKTDSAKDTLIQSASELLTKEAQGYQEARAALQKTYDEALTKLEGIYTENSWKELADNIEVAEGILQDAGAKLEEVETAENGLRSAIEKLELKGRWVKEQSVWAYIKSDGNRAKSEWVTIDGSKYYFGADSQMTAGWQKISGRWYYLGGAEDGSMKSGWQKLSGKWYYFGAADDGSMKSSTSINIGGKRYYFNKNGVCTNP